MIGKTISHYKILEKLGQGGMGVVYKAEDTKLGRTVALKFLPPYFSSDEGTKKRFINEAQTASALQQHNICTIHDIDETEDGQLFICMDFYKGKTLKEKIESGEIKTDEAIDIIVQVATGLQKAHEKAIIHRDIKPANIFITNDGIVKILDFGLAKLSGQTVVTKLGETLGTIAYMSPEQARGEEVDQRTDIWALGVVMYEMMTGTLPFNADYDQAVIYSILNENPKPINLLQKDIAPQLEKIIIKALEKEVSKRYQNIAELLKDLKSSKTPAVDILSQEKSIIVLPFDDLSPNHDQGYFSDGLTEEIISDLSGIKSLRVISRSSAMTFKGTKKKIPEIIREVNVQYVLEGSIRKAGNNLRITAQLIDAKSDTHLWAEKYSGTLEDIFDIQEKVSLSIADSLRLKIFPSEVELIKVKHIRDVETLEYYLRARDQINNFTPDALERAINYLQKAKSETGDNAAIFSGLAYAYAQYVNLGYEHEEYIKKAEIFAQLALQEDPNSSEALTVLGFVELWLKGNVKKSLQFLETSYSLRPNDTNTLMWLSVIYAQIGKIEEARKIVKRTTQIDPLTTLWYGVVGTIELYAGCFDEALQLMEKALIGEEGNPALQVFYTVALFFKQHKEQIRAFVKKHANQERGTSMDLMMILLSYSIDHRGNEMYTLFQNPETFTTFRRDSQWSWFTASAFACSGDFNAAMDWLENAVDRGFLNYETISMHDPFLSKFHDEPRFEKLIRRMKEERETFDDQ